MATEAETVGDRPAKRLFLRLKGSEVEMALRILVDQVDGRRNDIVTQRQERHDQFDTAAAA